MPLSPLKSSTDASLRRRKSSGITTLLLVLLGLAAVVWGYRSLRGFERQVKDAMSLAAKGALPEAEGTLSALEAKKPGDVRLIDARGWVASQKGEVVAAQTLYAQAENAGLKRDWAKMHSAQGLSWLKQGLYPRAEAEFNHALALDKGDSQAQQGLAVCAHSQGHLGKAIELYKSALALDPSLKEAKMGLRKANESRDRGVMYYLFDRGDQPLARLSIVQDAPGKKSYPYSQYTAHIVGANSEKFGDMGLEKDLKGLFPGIEVALTLDMRIQDAAQKALGWRKGAIVVLNPSTGEILAAVSQPSFKPEDLDKHPYVIRSNPNKPLLNRATQGLYEPGSICKIITAAAALEANVDMSRIFPMTPDTSIMIEGKVFRDWESHGKIRSLKEAMDVSSNIAMAKVAFAMGPDVLFEYVNRFGFNQPLDLGFDLPGLGHFSVPVATASAPIRADSQFTLAERACGLGREYRITPLHAALMAATVANKGVLMKPRLIKEVRNLVGQTLYASQPESARTIMKPDTAEKIKQIMMDAVEGDRGIGKRARVNGISVAGKTGTSRTHLYGTALDAWFICFAPADKPQYAIAVFGDGEGTGMSVAAPIAGNLLKELMR
ncbi:MAG: penicillin-binding transpeptidase domain-containing protein [candidate division FCPU426 bacterium]